MYNYLFWFQWSRPLRSLLRDANRQASSSADPHHHPACIIFQNTNYSLCNVDLCFDLSYLLITDYKLLKGRDGV